MALKWVSGKYVGETATIGPRLDLYVGWALRSKGETGPNYAVIVFGNTLTKRAETAEEGKAMAVRAAAKLLKDALAKLDQ